MNRACVYVYVPAGIQYNRGRVPNMKPTCVLCIAQAVYFSHKINEFTMNLILVAFLIIYLAIYSHSIEYYERVRVLQDQNMQFNLVR